MIMLKNKPQKLAKVDATEAAELAQKYDVTGYPTIKMFRKGSVFDYNGGRERHSIVSYLTEQAGPPSTEITTKKAFDNILKKARFKKYDISPVQFPLEIRNFQF